ncbi:MAG: helix-turn-helix domain-containing protein [Thiotrichaceae bacterium]|nr:helix-turn-helix domain-containing protein [Thiotrichaceae bacterium]
MNIAILNYPGALQSAVHGLNEMFSMASQLCIEHQFSRNFDVDIIKFTADQKLSLTDKTYTAVLLPPGLENSFYLEPAEMVKSWLIEKHSQGSILCSACAGSFIIASTGLLNNREATTHWGLVNTFTDHYPDVKLKANEILISDSDMITAGGMMSWVDLGLELVAQFTSPGIMRQLGKMLVIDTGQREQRYYQQFSPRFTHGDDVILNIQKKIQTDFKQSIKITELAQFCFLTERTFLRRFVKATGLKPSEYLQRLRIQKACEYLENSQHSFDVIANEVGYEDTGACRKIFVRLIGLTPGEFRKRFVSSRNY